MHSGISSRMKLKTSLTELPTTTFFCPTPYNCATVASQNSPETKPRICIHGENKREGMTSTGPGVEGGGDCGGLV
jgi:hypothetical protein